VAVAGMGGAAVLNARGDARRSDVRSAEWGISASGTGVTVGRGGANSAVRSRSDARRWPVVLRAAAACACATPCRCAVFSRILHLGTHVMKRRIDLNPSDKLVPCWHAVDARRGAEKKQRECVMFV
jgi:hypothetical protein